MRQLLTCVVWWGVAFTVTPSAWSQEWTRFRGPNGSGLGQATSLPAKWTPADYNWKAKLPGEGHSCPVVWGEKVFLLSADPQTATRYVLCLSTRDGRELWRREYASKTHKLHQRNTYASSTPAVDAERVYVAWSEPAQIALRAFDHEGRELWVSDLGPEVSEHGFGTSPMLFEDLVILANSQQGEELEPGQAPGKSSLLAVEAKSGQVRWNTPRTTTRACFATPCLYQPAVGPPELICASMGDGIYSLEPRTGRENWKFATAFTMRVVSSPLVAGGLVFGSTGSGGGGNYVVAVRPGPQPELAYTLKNAASYVPMLVARDKLLFMFNDKGVVTCCDLQTGDTHWRERVGTAFTGSPVLADGKLYIVSDEGQVYVLAAAKEFRLLGENPLGEPSRSTPAVAGGRLYFRTKSQLFSVGGQRP